MRRLLVHPQERVLVVLQGSFANVRKAGPQFCRGANKVIQHADAGHLDCRLLDLQPGLYTVRSTSAILSLLHPSEFLGIYEGDFAQIFSGNASKQLLGPLFEGNCATKV